MTQTISDSTVYSVENELRHFVLFLENHDGISWNTLRADLTSIFLSRSSDADYVSRGTFRAAAYAERYRATYWTRYATDKDNFHRLQSSFIAAAAAQIAYGEIEEFKLGNYTL